jgi:8-oxo-dGTP pyrophosphatase MutT (NUDIX family)
MAQLKGKSDPFGGVTVDIAEYESMTSEVFSGALGDSLIEWRGSGKRGIWLRFPLSAANLIPEAVKHGFKNHHAMPDYTMMTSWLDESMPSMLPLYPHHQIGVGGMLINGEGKVLCIQEKRGVTAGMKGFWKLPGGLVDPGEDISTAAAREVMEETGVKAQFVSIAGFRETHAGPFGTTDLYCICCMKLSDEYEGAIPEPSPQEEEIAATAWIDLDVFLGNKFYKRGLYGALLRTSAETAKDVMAGEETRGIGLHETKMKGMGGRMEGMYFNGAAKL